MKHIKLFTIGALCFLGIINSKANNVQIDNLPKLINQNRTLDHVTVQFDVSWENSWRNATNWDAIWVFVKYKVGVSDVWEHAYLSTTETDHSVTTINGVPAKIKVGTTDVSGTPRGMGVFMYRSAIGSGNINWDGVRLRWNYGENGVADDASITIKVFAIEMVYVPQGAFKLGDGFSNNTFRDGSTNDPFLVNAQGPITCGSNPGQLNWDVGTYTGTPTGTTNAAFPTGYNAFYCMKYLITQEQYVAFLNCLTYPQQAAMTLSTSPPNSLPGKRALFNDGGASGPANLAARNRIEVMVSGVNPTTPAVYGCDLNEVGPNANVWNQEDDGLNLACNFLTWAQIIGYCDWTGLRPMTELEYEKAARGTAEPVPGEYAWGTTNIVQATSINDPGFIYETLTDGANCTFNNGIIGVTRVGAFAKSNTTTREASGASFYGIMELSGSMYERMVTIGKPEGQAFTGLHGNGNLTAAGAADVPNWPSATTTLGVGHRGGSYSFAATGSRVSDRQFAANDASPTAPPRSYSFRAVRTAP